MARVWPLPACSTGCCICERRYRNWACNFNTGTSLNSEEYDTFVFDGVSAGNPITSDEECDQACRTIINPNDQYFTGPGWFACSNLLSTSIEYVSHSFQHGQSCCSISYEDFLARKFGDGGCFYKPCCEPNNPPRGATVEDYDLCNSEYRAAKCNLGFCLPATQTDPIECWNLTQTCGTAIPGSRRVTNNPSYCSSISDVRCDAAARSCCLL